MKIPFQGSTNTVADGENVNHVEMPRVEITDQPLSNVVAFETGSVDDSELGRDVDIKSSDEHVENEIIHVEIEMLLDLDCESAYELKYQKKKRHNKHSHNVARNPSANDTETVKTQRVRKKKAFFDDSDKYPSPMLAYKHKHKSPNIEELLCELCGKPFSTTKRLNDHKQMQHREKSFSCNICGLKYLREGMLLKHQNHVKRKNLKCEKCAVLFCTQSALELHKMYHVEKPGPDAEVYQCEHCNMYFGTWLGCYIHARRHVADEPCHCEVCGQNFMKLNDLNEHFKTHSEEELVGKKENLPEPNGEVLNQGNKCTCGFCGEMLTTRAYQIAHRIIHTTRKPYICEICNKTFRDTRGICSHMLSHTKERQFKCKVCGHMYIRKEQLKKHMKHHQGFVDKPYKCEICKQRFQVSSRLVYHLKIHTGERPHMCDQCGKNFRLKTGLQQHMLIHGGEKPYICSHCSKSFYTSSRLKIHMRTHTGEKPYACPYCDKRCAMRANVRKHMALHFKESKRKKANNTDSPVAPSVKYSKSEYLDDLINEITIETEHP